MKKIPIRDLHIPFRDQPKHHQLYRDFVAFCDRTGRNRAATIRVLIEDLVKRGKQE